MASAQGLKIGLYVDVANITMNGGYGMRYETLREFACRGDAEAVRLNAYVSFDSDRADNDPVYRTKQHNFHSMLRDLGYKVIEKRVKWYFDDAGNRFGKANVDLDLAVDALLQSEKMDRVLLATGDGDFVQVARALQNNGCRVEIVAFDNVSGDLRREADLFISGYLIPNLLPISNGRESRPWGEIGSIVRGICQTHDPNKPFGFLRYMHSFNAELWRTDARQADSAYRTVFCHDSELPRDLNVAVLPSRNIILEFTIAQGLDADASKLRAVDVRWVNPRA